MKRLTSNIILLLVLHTMLPTQNVTVKGSTDADGPYTTLGMAFTAINKTIQTGNNILVSVASNIYETATATLNAGTWASLSIFPSSSAGFTVNSTVTVSGPLINLNGADNVTIDGRVNMTGTEISLTITNQSVGSNGASTIQFDNGATNNIIRYCRIKGAGAGTGTKTRGTIYFSDAKGGNSFNTIENNVITSASTGRAAISVYSTVKEDKNPNASNSIINNSFTDFLNGGMDSYGIYMAGNNPGWTITGNSFFETADFVPSSGASFQIIYIESGEGNIISGNYIGGSAPYCEGTWNKTGSFNNQFTAISVNEEITSTAEVQGNTIRNITWINPGASTFTGILASGGNINIGTKEGNVIGSPTGNGSVALSGGPGSSLVYGINILSTGTVECRNNTIGSIAGKSPEKGAITIYAINISDSKGKALIGDNLIGSETSPESIISAGPASVFAQSVYGIAASGSGIAAITGNRIANLTNASSNESTGTTGVINGITITDGIAKIAGNTIHDLTIANANNSSLNEASAAGIVNASSSLKSVTGNTIYNISNSFPSFEGSVFGIYLTGSSLPDPNIVSQNFIQNLSVTGASSTGASMSGITLASGSYTLSNNIVSLGANTPSSVYGIHETSGKKDINSIQFNTIYIDGNPGSGTSQSAALYSSGEGSIRIIRNNIFCNSRSSEEGSNLHYAAWFDYIFLDELTLSHNDYFVPGKGAVLGYAGGKIITDLPFFTGSDEGSLIADPLFYNPGSSSATDYIPVASLNGFPGTGITDDYSATVRAAIPTMGAFEKGPFIWTGNLNNDWNTPGNWNPSRVPASDAFIAVNGGLLQYPVILNDLTVENINIGSGGSITVNSPNTLTVNGIITSNAGNSGLVLKSDATGNAKLIYDNSPVNATVELYITGGMGTPGPRFHYFIPPVQSMTIGSSIAEAKTNLGLTTFNGDLLAYDETKATTSTKKGWQFFDGYIGTTPFPLISSAQGYNFYMSASGKVTFKGELNTTAHTFKLNYTGANTDPGWNLVGNPFPCNYDLNGITALVTGDDNIDNTVYFNHEGAYYYRNVLIDEGTGITSDIIPPMQGFFVRVTSADNPLTLPVTSKTMSAGDPRSKGSPVPPGDKSKGIGKIKLRLENNSLSDETIVCLIDDASLSFDGDYDAFKLFSTSGNAPAIYSVLSDTNYAINSVPVPVSDPMIIPLKVLIKQKGTYSIKVKEFENLFGLKVVLKHGAAETSLGEDGTYTFTSNAGTFTDFQLVFNNSTTGAETLPVTAEKYKVWYSNEYLNINCPRDLLAYQSQLEVRDLQGKVVYSNPSLALSPGETIQELLPLPKGVYITRVIVNKRQFTEKIVVY